MKYDNEKYWINRGQRYKDEFTLHDKHMKARYKHQQMAFLKFLGRLQFETVLEIGCGFGRMTKLIYDEFQPKLYDAFDISPDQIENARRELGDRKVNLKVMSLDSFFPEKSYDLVFASEVLMHIPVENVNGIVAKMINSSRKYIVNLDWDAGTIKAVDYCFSHDYPAIYKMLGCKAQVIPIKDPPLSSFFEKRKVNQAIICVEK